MVVASERCGQSKGVWPVEVGVWSVGVANEGCGQMKSDQQGVLSEMERVVKAGCMTPEQTPPLVQSTSQGPSLHAKCSSFHLLNPVTSQSH